MFKKLMLVTASALAVFAVGFANTSGVANADGDGSPAACLDSAPNVLGSQGGEDNDESSNLAVVDVGAGNVVTGVCIKSGNNMFDGNKHSGVLGNGTYEDNCYTVTGVGTQVVTVTRIGEGPNCQGISHIDVLVGQPDDGEEEPEEPVVPPVTGGRGGSETPAAPAPAVTPQVKVPAVPAVNAGGRGSVVPSVVALGGSLSALGYGVARFRKFNA